MTTTLSRAASAAAARDLAAEHLYGAESALHAARQTGIDSWIRAAADRLHEAVVAFEAADLELDHAWANSAA